MIHTNIPVPSLVVPDERLTVVLHRNAYAISSIDWEGSADRDRVEGGVAEVTINEANIIPDIKFPDVRGTVNDPWVSIWRDDTLLCISWAIPTPLYAGDSFDLGINLNWAH